MIKRILFILLLLLFLSPLSAIAASGGGGSSEGDANKHDFAYVEMQQITVPIITNSGLTQQFSFTVSLEVPHDAQENVSRFGPRLTDAYIQDLYGALGAGYGFMQSGVINVSKVKQRLKMVTQSVLEPAHLEVNDVLLKVVQQYHF